MDRFLRDMTQLPAEKAPVKSLLLRCPRCESTQFIIKADPQPKDLATCGRCRGRFIYGHLTDEAEAEAARADRAQAQRAAEPKTPARETISAARFVLRWLRLPFRSDDDRPGPSPK